jgi:hypothetical protein
MSAGQDAQTSELPSQEANQPDPMLQMSRGWMGATGITIAALAIALILGVVFYGLNWRGTAQEAAAVPPNSAAVQSTNPAAGGKGGAATPGAPRANNSGVKG